MKIHDHIPLSLPESISTFISKPRNSDERRPVLDEVSVPQQHSLDPGESLEVVSDHLRGVLERLEDLQVPLHVGDVIGVVPEYQRKQRQVSVDSLRQPRQSVQKTVPLLEDSVVTSTLERVEPEVPDGAVLFHRLQSLVDTQDGSTEAPVVLENQAVLCRAHLQSHPYRHREAVVTLQSNHPGELLPQPLDVLDVGRNATRGDDSLLRHAPSRLSHLTTNAVGLLPGVVVSELGSGPEAVADDQEPGLVEVQAQQGQTVDHPVHPLGGGVVGTGRGHQERQQTPPPPLSAGKEKADEEESHEHAGRWLGHERGGMRGKEQ